MPQNTKQTKPIDLYFWTTPNGYKISIMLEELGVPYSLHMIDIGKGEQFAPAFLKISPNNRIPAIVDPEGPGGAPISVFESGAILKYLGLKFGALYPSDPRAQVKVDEWLNWQMGGFGPMLGQNHHFVQYAPEKIPYAIARYVDEAHRLYGVLDRQLRGQDYIAGEYSIADIATIGWANGYEKQKVDISEFSDFARWHKRMNDRPGVKRGLAAGRDRRLDLKNDEQARAILFSQRAR
jgi:GSH-dependent disulfide-bond oxidoreductase